MWDQVAGQAADRHLAELVSGFRFMDRGGGWPRTRERLLAGFERDQDTAPAHAFDVPAGMA